MRWCWSQDKDQRGRLGRQWNPQDPSWCSSPFLEHFHMIVSDTYFLTHHSALAKEDVDNSNVLMPGVVVLTFLRVRMKSNLCKVQSNWWQYVTPLIQRQEGRPCVFSSRSSARLRCRRGLRQLPAYKFDWPVLPWYEQKNKKHIFAVICSTLLCFFTPLCKRRPSVHIEILSP